jgi:hypothetical protein
MHAGRPAGHATQYASEAGSSRCKAMYQSPRQASTGSGLPFLIRTSTEVCFPDPGARLFVVKRPWRMLPIPCIFSAGLRI